MALANPPSKHFPALSWLAAVCAAALAACAGVAAAPPSTATAAPAAAASAAAQSAAALPLDPRITSGSLDNGLRYYLEPNRARDKRALLVLVVKAGSVYEEDDQRGLAHFIEHMAFNGTQRFKKQKLIDFFEQSGMKFGSHANAMTSYDRTEYQLNVPTDDPQLLATALDVLEDWASALSFDPEQLQKERSVLLSEWTSGKGAEQRLGQQQRRLLLAGSKFAEREVIGDKAVLEGAPRERLIDFYRRWYRPDRMAVIVVGDIDPSALLPVIEEHFGHLPRATQAPPEPSLEIPIKLGVSAAVLSDPETPASTVDVLFKAPARPVRYESDYRAQLVAVMSTLMLSRRLDELSDNPLAPFTDASSELAPSVLGRLDLIQVSARAKENQLQKSLDVLLDEIERVRRHGFSKSELLRSKEQYARFLDHFVAAQDTVDSDAISAGLANHFVTGNVVTAADFQKKLGLRLLKQISVSEVNATAVSWFSKSEELLLACGATRDRMPEQASLLAARDAAAKHTLEPYHDQVTPAALMSPLPTPGSVVKEEHIAEIDVTVWTLSNGARVVLKPTDFKQDQIIEQSISFGGNARVGAADFPSARVAHEVVAASGLGALDRQLLGRVLTGKVVSAFPWIDEQDEGIHASAAPKDAETMFQLIHLFATAPRRDERAFEAYRATLRERLRNRDLSPPQVFSDAIAKKLWGDQPRRLAPTLADVDQMKLDTALDFYRQRFSDVSDFTFVFVGKIDLASFRALAERYLASLPGGGRKETFHDLGLHRKKGISSVRVQQGKEDKASVTLIYHGESPWSENAHTDLVALENYLTMRLREVLREQLGRVYTPYVSANFERVPFAAYTLAISFECKPADVDELVKATRSTIAEVKKSGVADSYLEKLRSERTRDLEEVYRSNEFWLDRLVEKYKLGEDPRSILILTQLTQRITSENLRLAARQFLRGDQYVDALLTPAEAAVTPATAVQSPSPAAGPARTPAP
ncbi:MAG: insulinase family protein [Deltaproteobacteria bacterium]